jgi:fucose permease
VVAVTYTVLGTGVAAVSGHLVLRFGPGRVLTAGAAIAALGLGAVALGPSWSTFVAGWALVGVSAGLVDPTANAWFALRHGPRAMHLLHAAFGLGAAGGPLLVGASLALGWSWRLPFACAMVAQLVVVAGYVATGVTGSTGVAVDAEDGGSRLPVGRAAALMVTFVLAVALELGTGQWAASLLVDGRDVSEAAASWWLAAYWAAFMAGRLALAGAGPRLAPLTTLTAGAAVGAVAAVWLGLDPWSTGAVALPVLGAGMAGVFPSLVLVTPDIVGRHRAERAMGYQLAAAGVGAVAAAGITAALVDRAGIGAVGAVLAAFGGLLVASVSVLVRLVHRPVVVSSPR